MNTIEISYNKLLQKQIQEKFGNPDLLPPEMAELMNLVSHTYDLYEKEGYKTERSMDLSSTEWMEANARLEEQTQKLQRSNEQLREFAFAVSHDLKEPLRTIASYIQLIELRLKGNLDADTKDFMGYAVSGVRRLQQMLVGMLKYSQLEEAHNDFAKQDMNIVLEMTLENIRERIVLSEAEVKIHQTLPMLTGNRIQLIQLFQNLLLNSIKFRSPDKPRIDIDCEKRNHCFLFSIRDNGIGVHHSDKQTLFSLFRRGHSGEYEGIGLGLSICKKIVENHGGSIWIDNQVSQGCKVDFTLPL